MQPPHCALTLLLTLPASNPRRRREGEVSDERFCYDCKTHLPISMFYKNKGAHGGLCTRCKLCSRIRNKHLDRRVSNAKKQRDYVLRYPERQSARNAVNKAILRGEIKRQPCEKCGEQLAHAHHDDYSKPLDVRWLCHAHHVEAHTGMIPLHLRQQENAHG